MVVCVCNGIRERELRCVARSGANNPSAAYAALGRRPRCGQCFSFAREILASERATA
jgi:bacterioferritin-associated ferredoxin